jgi:hypothetical protein
MPKLIVGEGSEICNLCPKNRQDTIYHFLNGFNRMVENFTMSHNFIVDR